MKYADILQFSLTFSKYAAEYVLQDIIKNLNDFKSFDKRLKYCQTNFKKLGAGSARIAYLLPDGKVLKLAKNAKGVAQNNVESDYVLSASPVANGVIASDSNKLWVIANLATKVNAGFFKTQAGIDFETYCRLLHYWDHIHKGRLDISKPGNKNEVFEKIMDENQFVQNVIELIGNGALGIGDFCRLSSYGNVNGKLMVTDFGTSESVYQEYYQR